MVRKIKKSIEKKEENYDYLSEHLDIMLLFRIFQSNYSHRGLDRKTRILYAKGYRQHFGNFVR